MSGERILVLEPDFQRQLVHYMRDQFAPEDDVLRTVRENTPKLGLPEINIRPEEGQMLQFLVAVNGAKRILEIGTLAGYSGIWLARALPPGGKLITLELDPKHAAVARDHFRLAGLADRVELLEGSASVTLQELGKGEPFDMVFIDADKEQLPAYLEWSLDHVRSGGLITAHNAFREGRLFEDNEKSVATRRYHEMASHSDRLVSSTIIPIGDGIAAAVVR